MRFVSDLAPIAVRQVVVRFSAQNRTIVVDDVFHGRKHFDHQHVEFRHDPEVKHGTHQRETAHHTHFGTTNFLAVGSRRESNIII